MDPRSTTLTPWLVVLALVLPPGCGGSFIIDPGGGPGGGNGEGDLPAIPEPRAALSDAPMESEVITTIAPLTSNFRPTVLAARGDWTVNSRGRIPCPTQWFELFQMENTWSDELPEAYSLELDCGVIRRALPFDTRVTNPWRPLLMQDGQWNDLEPHLAREARTPYVPLVLGQYDVEWYLVAPLSNDVFMRRDRQWRRALIAGDVSLIIEGDISQSETVTHRSGISRTESETFARSLTASVGANWGVWSASVEGTISESFETSVTTTEETEVSETRTLNGSSGKRTVFHFWELVETYTICDEDGEPYSDPNYEFAPMVMEVRGQRTALIATEFIQ